MNFFPVIEERTTMRSPEFVGEKTSEEKLDISFQLYIELHSLLDAEACMNTETHKTVAYIRGIINRMNVVNAFEPMI